ncbi:2OG-Fe(II) oxygenase family protein [Streptomyces sp. SP17BM10]|uniref:2OG-Fe(II) oxygenase family protein n=1 Tax=Streptomyces sp. SP17BM10 TaxID=3002530 RepID=UPI002E790415|nr:2OG-Fe(II) oxygenase family protein [Streptomyces sp. SP17BM10]MEE1782943.1 2OG-Fe(II) oxygenase family protein [Streptomyces sp. SP17BM10]
MPVLAPDWTGTASCRTAPYRWLATAPGHLYDEDTAAELAATFPQDGYARLDATGAGRDKTYRNYSRPVLGPGHDAPADLPAPWRDLVADLAGEPYRRQVADLLDQPVAGAVEIRLVRHADTDWLGPHTDRADKLFSHVLYFNPGWQAEWGGCLEILDGDDPAAVHDRVVPRLGASALLVRSERSWHQVGAVTAGRGRERRSLVLHGLC